MRIAVRGEAPVELAPVRAAIRAALRPYGVPPDAVLALAFVADAEMRELNRRHRGKARTTDVLSFGQDLPPGAKGALAAVSLRRERDGTLELGDLVIGAAQARRQARRARRSLAREVAFLAAHGALHLLGFEDETRAGHAEMVRLGHAAAAVAGLAPGRSAVAKR